MEDSKKRLDFDREELGKVMKMKEVLRYIYDWSTKHKFDDCKKGF